MTREIAASAYLCPLNVGATVAVPKGVLIAFLYAGTRPRHLTCDEYIIDMGLLLIAPNHLLNR